MGYNSAIKFRLLQTAAVLLYLAAAPLFAAEPSTTEIRAAAEAEILTLSRAYRISTDNAVLLDKAKISLHPYLLSTAADGALIVTLTPLQHSQLQQQGFHVEAAVAWRTARKQSLLALIKGKKNRISGMAGSRFKPESCYPSVEETYAVAAALAENYPDLAEWIDIGDSWEKSANLGGYDLKVLKLGNRNISKTRPRVFLQSSMHPREMTPALLTLDLARDLLSGYGRDADDTWILNQREIYILIMMNPDGRKFAENNLLWRKNTNRNYCSATSNDRGADLNRNYSYLWNIAQGSSDNACDETYHGPFAASEPEVAAVQGYVRSLFPDRRGPLETDAAAKDTPGLYIDIHAFGDLILYPWGHTSIAAPNHNGLATLAKRIQDRNTYTAMQAVGLYPTDGTSESLSYGELGLATFTLELGQHFFETCIVYENDIKTKNLTALKYAIRVARAPYLLSAGPNLTDLQAPVNGTTAALSVTATTLPLLLLRPGTAGRANVAAAEYSVDILPSEPGATTVALEPQDGSADSPTEIFTATVDLSGLTNGRHMLYVRSQIESGQWGETRAIFVDTGNPAPQARFGHHCNGTQCSFNASSSVDDGTLIDYRWNFGDGSSLSGISVAHVFPTIDTYLVSLTVTDNLGGTATVQEKVIAGVSEQPPVASFTTKCNGQQCNFDATASSDSDGAIVRYSWDFGDGSSANSVSSTHTYAHIGHYQVSLTVVDDGGNIRSHNSYYRISASSSSGSGGSKGGSMGLWLLVLIGIAAHRRIIASLA